MLFAKETIGENSGGCHAEKSLQDVSGAGMSTVLWKEGVSQRERKHHIMLNVIGRTCLKLKLFNESANCMTDRTRVSANAFTSCSKITEPGGS